MMYLICHDTVHSRTFQNPKPFFSFDTKSKVTFWRANKKQTNLMCNWNLRCDGITPPSHFPTSGSDNSPTNNDEYPVIVG